MELRSKWPIAVACAATLLPAIACSSDSDLADKDSDGDGLSDKVELYVYGTSPLLADTDGDGFSDYDEIVKAGFNPDHNPYHFNPRVADGPQLALVFVGPPAVQLVWSTTQGTTNTVGASRSDQVTNGVTDTSTSSQSPSTTSEIQRQFSRQVARQLPIVTGTDAGDAEVDANDGGRSSGTSSSPSGSITLTNGVMTTNTNSTTFQASISFSEAQNQQVSRTLTEDQTYEQNQSMSATGAFLKVPAIVTNRSNIGVLIDDIALGAWYVAASGAVVPVGGLSIEEDIYNRFIPFELEPGAKTDVLIFSTPLLGLDITQAMLANARTLLVRFAAYHIEAKALTGMNSPPMTGDSTFSYTATEIGQRTATIVIDYGPQRPPDVFQVATNLDPGHEGITAGKAFGDILRMSYDVDGDGRLAALRRFGTDPNGGAHWAVTRFVSNAFDSEPTQYGASGESYDFNAIELHSGDVLDVALGGGRQSMPPLAPTP